MEQQQQQQQQQQPESHVVPSGKPAAEADRPYAVALAQAAGGVGAARKPTVTALPRREFADTERRFPAGHTRSTTSSTHSIITATSGARRPKLPGAEELDRLQSEHEAIRALVRGGGAPQ